MAGNVFINYRRGDEPAAAGRLFDHLERSFPPERLFLDVDSIPAGRDFVKELEIKVEACDVLLAVIGRNWLGAADAGGALRLNDPKDFVHIEIATALRLDKRVIPVLVNDAQMPRPDDLPEPLKPLAYRNAVRLTHERFRADAQGLVKAIEAAVAETRAEREAADAALATRRAEQHALVERTPGQSLSSADIAKAEELANWDFIKASDKVDDFRDHLARFPAGVTHRMAGTRLENLVWQSLGPAPDAAALQAFLTEFSTGTYASAARARLELPPGGVETRRAPAFAYDHPTSPGSAHESNASRRRLLVGGGAAAAAAGVAAVVIFTRTPPTVVREPAPPPPRPSKPRTAETPNVARPGAPKAAERGPARLDAGSVVTTLAVAAGSGRALVGTKAGGLQLWDAAAGLRIATFGDPAEPVRAAAIAADGASAVAAVTGGAWTAWSLRPSDAPRKLRSFGAADDGALAIALSADGTTALCASTRSGLELWTVAAGIRVRQLRIQGDPLAGLAMSGDGRMAVSGYRDGTIRLWDLAKEAPPRQLSGHTGAVLALAVSLDGSLILSGSEDRSVRLWQTTTGRPVRVLRGHRAAVTCAAFTPDGRHCLSGSRDGTVRLWDVHNGRPMRVFDERAGAVTGLGVIPSPQMALAGTETRSLPMWPIAGLCRRPG